ncbi:Na+/H+ antiporter NhaA (plasmid) [Spirosoma sp. SC4-14]|uniref:Na+/H+ antiporter NhaA n=1 Tax=Spirosoma sp. SC4-14 TaxID=3128900 RepID=UPI0030CD40A8
MTRTAPRSSTMARAVRKTFITSVFNWLGVRIQGLYLLLGLVLWYLTLKLGIHAPLAGIR